MQGSIRPKELRDVLGRITFAALAIDIVKPFLGPVYARKEAVSEVVSLPIPAMLKIIFRFVIKVFRDARLYMTDVKVGSSCTHPLFRGDAHASDDGVGVGGWRCDEQASDAAWFAFELDRTSAPWIFHAGESFRTIASLELFTTLLCVKLLVGIPNASDSVLILGIVAPSVTGIAGETDNRSNTY